MILHGIIICTVSNPCIIWFDPSGEMDSMVALDTRERGWPEFWDFDEIPWLCAEI